MDFLSLAGERSYSEVRALQLEWVEKRVRDEIPDTVLFLEHSPVITRGRGLQWTGAPREKSLPLGILPEGIAYEESERGGDLTYHGPGQLVVYPICKLDGKGFAGLRDVTGYLRKLENVVIDELKSFGLDALSKADASGVWIGDRKIASLGIAIRKWVSFHGIAINCTNALEPFYSISPCGFSPEVMARLSDWISLDANWRSQLENSLAQRMAPGAVVRKE